MTEQDTFNTKANKTELADSSQPPDVTQSIPPTTSTVPDETAVSRYMDYLPAIFWQVENDTDMHMRALSHRTSATPFIGRFLLAFEALLHGLPDDVQHDNADAIQSESFNTVLDHLERYFQPHETPEDFLPWLSGWVALTLRNDWSTAEKRDFIARVVPLYRMRGTERGLKIMLLTYLNAGQPDDNQYDETAVQINMYEGFQIGRYSTVGDPLVMVGDPPPYHFRVRLLLADLSHLRDLRRKAQIARAIIDREKPAHTTFDLSVYAPGFQVGVYSTVGSETLLLDSNREI